MKVYRVWHYTEDGARYMDFKTMKEAKKQASAWEEFGYRRIEIEKTDDSYIPTLRW